MKMTVHFVKLTVRTCQEAISKGNFIFQPFIFRCFCCSFQGGKSSTKFSLWEIFGHSPFSSKNIMLWDGKKKTKPVCTNHLQDLPLLRSRRGFLHPKNMLSNLSSKKNMHHLESVFLCRTWGQLRVMISFSVMFSLTSGS